MTIQFQCNGCGDKFNVPDTMAGTKARCNQCGAVLTVPSPLAPAPLTPAPSGLQPIPQQPAAQQPTAPAQPALTPAPQQAAPQPGLAPAPQQPALTPAPQQPGLHPAPQQPFGGQQPFAKPGPQPQPKSSVSPAVLIAAIGGGGALLVLGIAIVATMLLGGDDEPQLAGADAATTAPSTPKIDFGKYKAKSAFPTMKSGGGKTRPRMPSMVDPSSGKGESGGGGKGKTAPKTNAGAGGNTTTTKGGAKAPRIPDIANFDIPDDFKKEMEKNIKEFKGRLPGGDNGSSTSSSNKGGSSLVAAPKLDTWTAKPDPPTDAITYKTGKFDLSLPKSCTLVYPETESNFLLVKEGSFREQALHGVDLRDGKQYGTSVKGDLDIASKGVRLSPDGKYAAAATGSFGRGGIAIWSMETGEQLHDLKIEKDQQFGELHFGKSTELVLFTNDSWKSKLKIRVLNVISGDDERSFEVKAERRKAEYLDKSFTISHGGNYAAMVIGDKLTVIDLQTGDSRGQTPFPKKPSKFIALAFSPDGAELAGLFNIENVGHLFIWNMEDGQPTVVNQFNEKLDRFFSNYGGSALSWYPDKSFLLYDGRFLLDTETGQEVWRMGGDNRDPRKPIGHHEFLVKMKAGSKGQVLKNAKLTSKDIDKALEAVRNGGSAYDAALPPLSSPDLFSASSKSPPVSLVDWSAKPDALAFADELSIEDQVLIAPEGVKLKSITLAGASGKALVMKEVSGSGQQSYSLEQYDLKREKRGSQIPLPSVYELIDADPTGGQALVGLKTKRAKKGGRMFSDTVTGYDRLDVLSTDKRKHVAGWRPYEGEDAVEAKLVKWAAFVNATHVATINAEQKLIVWQIPECKAKYVFADFGELLALTPTHKYVVAKQKDVFRLYDLASGECQGELETPTNGFNAIRAAVRPDGREMAAVIAGASDRTLARWDLTSGELTHNFPIHPKSISSHDRALLGRGSGKALDYRGDRHLLLDHKFLIDMQNRAVVWRFHQANGLKSPISPDGRHWICAPDGKFNGPMYVRPINMPSATVAGKSEFNSLEDQLVLYPGMRIAVGVQLGAGSGQLTPQEVLDGVTTKLKVHGLIVDQQNPQAYLQLSTSSGATGEQLVVGGSPSPFGGGIPGSPYGGRRPSAGDVTFTQEKMTCTLTLKDLSGRVRWTYSQDVAMRSFGNIDKTNAQNSLRQEMQNGFQRLLLNGAIVDTSIPRYVFKEIDEVLSGESDLALGGETPHRKAKPNNAPGGSSPGYPGGSPGAGGFPGSRGGGSFPGSRPSPGFPGR